jgi:hypothetical protein
MRTMVDSCVKAVTALADVDQLLLVCSRARLQDVAEPADFDSIVHLPGTAVSSAIFTGTRGRAHFQANLAGSAGGVQGRYAPGVGVVVGAALAAAAGLSMPTTAIELGEDGSGPSAKLRTDDPGTAGELLSAAKSSPERFGLLMVADGSGSRGAQSPGGGYQGAEAFDAALVAALAHGDAAALAGLAYSGQPAQLLFASGPAFRVLAELASDAPVQRAQVLYADAPLGVGYVVATWSWD